MKHQQELLSKRGVALSKKDLKENGLLCAEYDLYEKLFKVVNAFDNKYTATCLYERIMRKIALFKWSWRELIPKEFHELYAVMVKSYQEKKFVVWDKEKIEQEYERLMPLLIINNPVVVDLAQKQRRRFYVASGNGNRNNNQR